MNLLIDKYGFIVYHTSKEQIFYAKDIFAKRFSSSFSLNSKTVYDRMESRLAGIVGEMVYQSLFPKAQKTPDRDIPFDFLHDGLKVDVKCKYRKVDPRDDFEASFFEYQMKRSLENVNRYVFMSTKDDFSKVWICGYIDKSDFMSRAKLWKKGQTDPTNRKVFHENTLSVFYSQLNKYELRK